jgi:hypothetical protein
MTTYRRMRASDQDREEVAALLGDAFAAGRLTQDELDERCAAAYAARTWGELDDLTADLPGTLSVVRVRALPPPGALAQLGQPQQQSVRQFGNRRSISDTLRLFITVIEVAP